MLLSIFTDFCNCWWLAWLLPFILGMILGCLLCRARQARNTETDLSVEPQVSNSLTSPSAAMSRAPISPPASAIATGIAASKFAALKSDNLQVVEGIGPKMDEILKSNGINSWKALGSRSSNDLRKILNNYGDRYRIIDPGTWSDQAKFAANGDWDGLIAMQKNLNGGKTDATNETDSKVEKIMIKLGILKRWKQDDLKAVEGIGPKIEGLLHADGIKTWKDLSEASTDRIQGVLDRAGSRYKLANPGTWPRQAELAHLGKWDELEKLQDELTGGR